MTKRISSALAIAGFMLLAAGAIRFAQSMGVIGAETAGRGMQVVIGIVLAIFGNFMPKDVTRFQMHSGRVLPLRSPLRVGGWAFTLAGLAYAGFSAFAPNPIADTAAMAVVAAAMLVTAGYAGWVALNCRRQDPSTGISD